MTMRQQLQDAVSKPPRSGTGSSSACLCRWLGSDALNEFFNSPATDRLVQMAVEPGLLGGRWRTEPTLTRPRPSVDRLPESIDAAGLGASTAGVVLSGNLSDDARGPRHGRCRRHPAHPGRRRRKQQASSRAEPCRRGLGLGQ